VATKELQTHFSYVWQGKELREFFDCARSWRDAGRRTASVALTTKHSEQKTVRIEHPARFPRIVVPEVSLNGF